MAATHSTDVSLDLLNLLDSPLIKHKITLLRSKHTLPAEFRRLTRELSTLVAVEAAKDMELEQVQEESPITTFTGYRIKNKLAIVPIMRAGNAMLDSLLELFPSAPVYHLGTSKRQDPCPC